MTTLRSGNKYSVSRGSTLLQLRTVLYFRDKFEEMPRERRQLTSQFINTVFKRQETHCPHEKGLRKALGWVTQRNSGVWECKALSKQTLEIALVSYFSRPRHSYQPGNLMSSSSCPMWTENMPFFSWHHCPIFALYIFKIITEPQCCEPGRGGKHEGGFLENVSRFDRAVLRLFHENTSDIFCCSCGHKPMRLLLACLFLNSRLV